MQSLLACQIAVYGVLKNLAGVVVGGQTILVQPNTRRFCPKVLQMKRHEACSWLCITNRAGLCRCSCSMSGQSTAALAATGATSSLSSSKAPVRYHPSCQSSKSSGSTTSLQEGEPLSLNMTCLLIKQQNSVSRVSRRRRTARCAYMLFLLQGGMSCKALAVNFLQRQSTCRFSKTP